MLAATWVTAIATAVLALGLPLTVITWLGTRRSDRMREQREFQEALSRAVEQLGADKLDVRIGGIYSLERVARDSARDHPTVMEILATFVREHSNEQWPFPHGDDNAAVRTTRPDVQAALTVIGRRNTINDQQPINLSSASLRRAVLAHANLVGADLVNADLAGADLMGADLTGATLLGADLTDARLSSANLSRSALIGANLSAALLNDARLTHTDLSRATLQGAQLYDVDLTGASLRATDLTGADLTGADLTGADLTGGSSVGISAVPAGWALDAKSGRLKRSDQ
jgi:hypothetical protein